MLWVHRLSEYTRAVSTLKHTLPAEVSSRSDPLLSLFTTGWSLPLTYLSGGAVKAMCGQLPMCHLNKLKALPQRIRLASKCNLRTIQFITFME